MAIFEVKVIEVKDDNLQPDNKTGAPTIPVTVPVSDQVKELVNVLQGEMSREQDGLTDNDRR